MNLLAASFYKIHNWAKANSLTPFVFASSCCEVEMTAAVTSDYDIKMSGKGFAENPRQADLLIVAGTITHKNAPILLKIYEQMPEPKYVIALGACACSGGMYCNDSYSVVNGADKIIPVDIYIPMCPPKSEAIQDALIKLQQKIKTETYSKRKEYLDSHIPELTLSKGHDILVYDRN